VATEKERRGREGLTGGSRRLVREGGMGARLMGPNGPVWPARVSVMFLSFFSFSFLFIST
jgi:hypothetical protein